MTNPPSTEDIELKLVVEALALRYGYDFRSYAEASLKRRVTAFARKNHSQSVLHLTHELLYDERRFAAFLSEFTVTTSELFRDPSFFRSFRERVVPVLRTYPSFRIWHAGCGGGEEVYSLAILLAEEGLDGKGVVYATDINPAALARAKDGIFATESVQKGTANYQAAGGKQPFSKYYTAAYGAARFAPELVQNVLFSEHNLVTDDVFAEMHVILCRNVLIYFKRDLQKRVLALFRRSLAYKGFLCLGSKEALRFIEGHEAFDDADAAEKIYRLARDPEVEA
jgi:chemotaxis protein methyltransferase CheR